MRRGPTPLRASAVIPVRNGEPYLGELLSSLAEQELDGGLEVIAVDSGSVDRSREVLDSRGVRVIPIDAASFDHGETRNRGAREARGTFVLFLSQDALPRDRAFVRRLVEALERDDRLAGAFARQLPRPDADPLTRRDLAAWVAAGTEPRTVFLSEGDGFDALAPIERLRLAAFDDVASVVRRDLLLAHPFERTRFGEDLEWGHRMLHLGHGVVYVPEAVVLHSHRRTARGLFRRNYLGHRLLHRLFGLRTVPDVPHLVGAAMGAVASDLLTLAREGAGPGNWLAAPVQAVAATYGEYRGARDEALSRPYPEWA